VYTTTTGFYRVAGLPLTDVVVHIADCVQAHAPEWFDDSPARANARVLSLASGVTATANASLGQGARISGTVSGSGSCSVRLENVEAPIGIQGYATYGATSPTGFYSLDHVAPGRYRLGFFCGNGYAPTWYQDSPRPSTATIIPIGPSATVTADVVMATEASAAATLINPDTGKPTTPCLSAVDADGVRWWFSYDVPYFTLRNLPAGHYDVIAGSCGNADDVAADQTVGSFDAAAGGHTSLENTRIVPRDRDGDGVSDKIDNCPMTANADQADRNRDDLGNVCDLATMAAKPKLSVADVSVLEGNTLHPLDVHVKLSQASTEVVKVTVKTKNGSAVAGSDYNALTTQLTFSPGEIDKTFAVSIRGDGLHEANEIFSVVLSSPSGALVGRAKGSVTLRNDD
jgi:hypothetical protein